MKTPLVFASTIALSVLALAAQAQTPATTHGNPAPAKATQKADQRAATYQGPKVVKDSKALGQKMVQKSKPTDGPMRADMLTKPPVQKVK
jgi:hypothetical protein